MHPYLMQPLESRTLLSAGQLDATFGNAGVQSALDVIASAVRPSADDYAAIAAGLAANDIAPLSTYLKSIVANSSSEIATFLSDATVRAALASATSDAVIDLTSGPALRTWLADLADGWVSEALGDSAAASAVGNAVGGAPGAQPPSPPRATKPGPPKQV